jgi:hypothetical protein
MITIYGCSTKAASGERTIARLLTRKTRRLGTVCLEVVADDA